MKEIKSLSLHLLIRLSSVAQLLKCCLTAMMRPQLAGDRKINPHSASNDEQLKSKFNWRRSFDSFVDSENYSIIMVSSPPKDGASDSKGTPLPRPSNNSLRTSGPIFECPFVSRRSSNASL